jgi:hypothetical protein
MTDMEWRQMPVGPEASREITRKGCKTVLIAVHSVTMGQRLIGVLPLFESDHRIQVVFTAVPGQFGNGVARFLRRLDGVVIPWEQATEINFDLALAAGRASMHELRAPVIVMPHGAGRNKLMEPQSAATVVGDRSVYGLDMGLVQGGRVVPAAIVLSHAADLSVLGRQCPEALPVAEVVGDPCHDQIAVSKPMRADYRHALGATAGTRVVVITSTWGTPSLFGQFVDLHDRVLAELDPSRHVVVALMHPNVWYGHGPRQVRAWLGSAMRRGLALVPPDSEWLGALIAADVVLGDAGSATAYASAAGAPVIMGTFPVQDIAPGSVAALLAAWAPRLRSGEPIGPQLDEAVAHHDTRLSESVAARITSEPGRFNRNMRRMIYRMLDISQPSSILAVSSAAAPTVIRRAG